MTTTFIDTNKLSRVAGFEGEFTEILNKELAGAKNVLGTLRWLQPGESFNAEKNGEHQLIYLMEGSAVIALEGKDYEVSKGSGAYLGPEESASIRAASPLKLFHLVVPKIPE